jgi:hypothetical protein
VSPGARAIAMGQSAVCLPWRFKSKKQFEGPSLYLELVNGLSSREARLKLNSYFAVEICSEFQNFS